MAKILAVNVKRKELEVAHDLSQQKKIKGVDAGMTLLMGGEGEEEDSSLVFPFQQQEVEAITAETLPRDVKRNYDPVVTEEVVMDEASWLQYKGLGSTQMIEESQSPDKTMEVEEEDMEGEEQRGQWQEPTLIWSGFF